MVNQNILQIIGQTSLIKVGNIFAKLETTNPSGSVKDRMVGFMVEKAEAKGELKPGFEIIEVTSGNTGISLAMIAALKGCKFTAVMPESASIERRKMIAAFGGKIILTPAEEDMTGAVARYQQLVQGRDNIWLPRQFANEDNILAHEQGLGQEIIAEMIGGVDVWVAGVGTGGTLLGVARALKKVNPQVRVVAVEPAESAVLSGHQAGHHQIQGIGEGFIPEIVQKNISLIDEVIIIESQRAIEAAQRLAKEHGLLVGTSSGANILAAQKLSEKYKKVVTVLPDRGERYLA